ncbi:uncharacterized protein LOC122265327 [Penaeus japonicus]|uniref:uncharacterized protein LOC122265327 n=1 Tax=Penaeus japonicus TaxID=27405 RepID=UPI001C711914|nr:uncharacterized protein LOC122265327 [Penaeus japonicus]
MASVVLLAALVASVPFRPVLAGARSIGYILGGGMGNMLIADNKELIDEQTLLTVMNATSVCRCRSLCLAHVNCKGVSATPVGDHFVCKLVGKTVDICMFADTAGATFIFWEDSVDHSIYELMPDGFLYLEPIAPAKHQEARAFCSRIPGHRLAILKTQAQREALYALHERTGRKYNVDLIVVGGVVQWGDGTVLSEDEQNSMGVDKTDKPDLLYENDKFTATDKEESFLCQANPTGYDW